ncbi:MULTISPECIES: SRPBCC family protein [unclassified Streptomyces]|uniref:SRPBCC family protein n=1 Tax=unclassified Streptomyces TaxID=2593676 RepID=UPI00332274F4
MKYSTSLPINATPDRIWSVMTDVERWPDWTPTVTTLHRLDRGEFAVGSKVRIKQPQLRVADWEVTRMHRHASFTWVSHVPGVTTKAGHALSVPATHGAPVEVTLALDQRGPLAGLVGLFTASLTRRYMETELRSLKARCESGV